MDSAELDAILDELRRVGTDTQYVEAKKAGRGLPTTTAETVSAFANADGGLLLLGVDEANGAFNVTGVTETNTVQTALQTLLAEMEPPMRAAIELIAHPDGVVLKAAIDPVSRNQLPCHRRSDGPHRGSFIRVGDADQALTTDEVTELLALRSQQDRTAMPANGQLDTSLAQAFVTATATRTSRTETTADEVLQNWGALDAAGGPTLAGRLVLGTNPQGTLPAARVSYIRHPRASSPPSARHSATHLEGTLGELLDGIMTQLIADLRTVQISRGGSVRDDSDVPREAMRELVSNALVHRSFTDAMIQQMIKVEVSDDAVVVVSPGGITFGTDPSSLGMLHSMGGVRNPALVRLAEMSTTPSGSRIAELQQMGIRAADKACRRMGVLPALFADHPTAFHAQLLRKPLNMEAAANLVPGDDEAQRVLAAAMHMKEVQELPVQSRIRTLPFDSRFAARVLAPCSVDDAAVVLARLVDQGHLERAPTPHNTWRLRQVASLRPKSTTTPPTSRKNDRLRDLLLVLGRSRHGELRAKDIGDGLGLRSPSSRNNRLREGVSEGLIEPTKDNPYDPGQSYRMTDAGRIRLDVLTRGAE